MRNLKVFTVLIMLLFAQLSFAYEPIKWSNVITTNHTEDCGVMLSTDSDVGLVVNPSDATICEEDVIGNILYFMFGDILKEIDLVNTLIKVSDPVAALSKAYTSSKSLAAVITAVTVMAVSVGTMIIAYTTVSALYKSRGGEFMGREWDWRKVTVRTGGSLLSIFPVFNGFSLIQIMVLIVAVYGSVCANFIWGYFLNVVQVASVEMSPSELNNINAAIDLSETQILGDLCAMRTSKKVLEDNWANFERDSSGPYLTPTKQYFQDKLTVKKTLDRYNSCLRPATTYGTKRLYRDFLWIDGYASLRYTARGNPGMCGYNSVNGKSFEKNRDYIYHENLYGGRGSCSYMTFNVPSLEELDYDSDGARDGSKAALEGAKKLYLSLEDGSLDPLSQVMGMEPILDGIINDSDKSFNLIDTISKYNEIRDAKERKSMAELNLRNWQEAMRIEEHTRVSYGVALSPEEGDKIEQREATLVAAINNIESGFDDLSPENLSLFNAMIPISDGLRARIVDQYKTSVGVNSSVKKIENLRIAVMRQYFTFVYAALHGAFVNANPGFSETSHGFSRDFKTKDFKYLDRIYKELIIPAAEDIEGSHCAFTWLANKKSRETVKNVNQSMSSKTKDVPGAFECVNIDPETGELRYSSKETLQLNVDIDPATSGDESAVELANLFYKNQVAHEHELSAITKKNLLAIYYYLIREAVGDAYSEISKAETDTETPIKIRKRGWGAAGAYMIEIAAGQRSNSAAYEEIISSVKWGSDINLHQDPLLINMDVFKLSSDVDGEQKERYQSTFNNVYMPQFLSRESRNMASSDGFNTYLESISESVSLEYMFHTIEGFITHPLRHLKYASGVGASKKPLRVAIKECAAEGTCTMGSTHPMNALMAMGDDLVFGTVSILMVNAVAKAVASIDEVDADGTVKSSSGLYKYIPFIGAIINTIIKFAKVLVVIFKVFMPLILSLLFVGILFAYIVPMIPFVAFMVVLINWLVLIVELMVVLPVWAITYAITGEDGRSKAQANALWNFFGQVFFKPSFLVISLIVAWSISSISLYIINMTFFAADMTTNSGTSFINRFIDVVMFYVIYVIIVFVALRQAFSVIGTMQDTMLQRIGINSTGDQDQINNMDMERIMQAGIVTKVIQGALVGAGDKAEKLVKQHQRNKRKKKNVLPPRPTDPTETDPTETDPAKTESKSDHRPNKGWDGMGPAMTPSGGSEVDKGQQRDDERARKLEELDHDINDISLDDSNNGNNSESSAEKEKNNTKTQPLENNSGNGFDVAEDREEKATSQMRESKEQAAEIIENANKRANQIIDEAKEAAKVEGDRLVAAAQAEVEQEVNRAKEKNNTETQPLENNSGNGFDVAEDREEKNTGEQSSSSENVERDDNDYLDDIFGKDGEDEGDNE